MAQNGTTTVIVKINISSQGVSLALDGIDSDLADLLYSAGTFQTQAPVPHSLGASDVVIKSTDVITFTAPPTTP